ncbi:MAG: hypothetical protein SNJ74_11880 [Fimbriimonadaceae bacterium]
MPTSTRQGTYALAPNGTFLGSVNTNDPAAMARMLRTALARWEVLRPEERRRADDPASVRGDIQRPERFFPEDGLVLRVFSRDLPREGVTPDWRGRSWNQDFAWFRRSEVARMVPESREPGQKRRVPDDIWVRFVRLNIVDNVRGQTGPYAPREVKRAELTTEVLDRRGSIVRLRLTGSARVEAEGRWPIRGFADRQDPSPQRRGIDLEFFGEAEFDETGGRFVRFDLVGQGTRWGATQYNGRYDDPGPAPIGFATRIAGDSPAERVAPAHWFSYGWR